LPAFPMSYMVSEAHDQVNIPDCEQSGMILMFLIVNYCINQKVGKSK
jgi:hypothetical protein